jgi:hypothetical protein
MARASAHRAPQQSWITGIAMDPPDHGVRIAGQKSRTRGHCRDRAGEAGISGHTGNPDYIIRKRRLLTQATPTEISIRMLQLIESQCGRRLLGLCMASDTGTDPGFDGDG